MRTEILLVDDERVIRAALRGILEDAGYLVTEAADGRAAVDAVRSRRPGLVLLDVMMPVMDGRATCAEIRKFDKSLPVVFLTALDSAENEIDGLKAGGDDYVSKTARTDVLLARVASALRRVSDDAAGGDFVFGRWYIDSAGGFMSREGSCAKTPLSEREIAVLRAFRDHPGKIFSRDYLARMICDEADGLTDEALTMFFVRLRSKLGDDAFLVKTVRGCGYVYRL